MAFGDWLRRFFHKVFPKKTLENKLKVQIATSVQMENAIELWLNMYSNHPPWEGGVKNVMPLNLPASIAEEMARLTLTEFSLEVGGSPRADFINSQLTSYKENLSNIMERWAALGGIALKPYVSGDDGRGKPTDIRIDINTANRFFPTAFNSNKDVTGAVFLDTKHVGDYIYTRLEYHSLNGSTYRVTNKAYRSERLNSVGTETETLTCAYPFLEEVPLDTVEDWAGLSEETELLDMDTPLFVYVRIPRANNLDPESPLGASVFSRAVGTIEQADRQYSRTLWEYEAKEAAVFADESLLEQDSQGRVNLADGDERLYRTFDVSASGAASSGVLLKEYSPAIRDASMQSGMNELLRRIETQCGLAYGTLSNAQDTEKTATEIKMSKQRSYTTIHAMQTAWEHGIDHMLAAMDKLCDLYDLAPAGRIEKVCTWGDSVLEDSDVEYNRRFSMVSAGLMRQETFLAWYFGISEEEAAENYLPKPEHSEEETALDETEE